jgi:DNA-binding GntR family transcriptional regulator
MLSTTRPSGRAFSQYLRFLTSMSRLLKARIYESIRDKITCGKLLPGERIVEFKLAEQYHASRSPIREALCQLESEGLIRVDKRGGISVSKLSIRDIDELYDIRLLLESHAARLAAEQAVKSDAVYLTGLQRKMKTAAKANDIATWLKNNSLFHNFFIRRSKSQNLEQMLEILKRRIYRYKYITVQIPGHFAEYIQHHEAMLRAVRAKDGKMAQRHMELHIKTVKKLLIDCLNEFPGF